MKRASLAAALCLSLAGCGSSGDQPNAVPVEAGAPRYDGPPAVDPGPPVPSGPDGGAAAPDGAVGPAFSFDWVLTWIGENEPVSCAEARTPNLKVQVTAGSGQVFMTRLPCVAGSGYTLPLAPGRYRVTVELENEAGAVVSALQGDFELAPRGLTDLGVVTLELQSFVLAWEIARGSSVISCTNVDATTVELIARLGNEPEVVYAFPCAAGRGATPAIRTGTYTLGLKLRSSTSAVLWETATPMTLPVNDQGRAILPPVRFDLP